MWLIVQKHYFCHNRNRFHGHCTQSPKRSPVINTNRIRFDFLRLWYKGWGIRTFPRQCARTSNTHVYSWTLTCWCRRAAGWSFPLRPSMTVSPSRPCTSTPCNQEVKLHPPRSDTAAPAWTTPPHISANTHTHTHLRSSTQWASLTERLLYLSGQSVEDSPEELSGQMQLLVWGGAEAAPSSGQTVVLPAALVVIGQELREDTPTRPQFSVTNIATLATFSHKCSYFYIYLPILISDPNDKKV